MTRNITANVNRAITASPPTTPPTIAPTGTDFEFEEGGVEEDVESTLSWAPPVVVGALSSVVVGLVLLPVLSAL